MKPLLISLLVVAVCCSVTWAEVTSDAAKRKLAEEARFREDKELRARTIEMLLARGKELAEQREYDRAVEVLERVFVLDPINLEASQEIDRIKERFIKETMDAYEQAGRVLDEEMSNEIAVYISSSKTLIKRGQYADAKILLHKILVLDPKNKEAKKLLKQCEKS